MPTRPVRIIKGNSDGTLEIIPCTRREAHRGDTILWQIDHNSGVYEIVLIDKKQPVAPAISPDIWQTLPRKVGNNWQGDISTTAPLDTPYYYFIKWKATATGPVLTQDPIITIRPSSVIIINFTPIGKTFNWILSSVLFITGISFFILWKMKRKEANKLRKELEDCKHTK